MRGLDPARGILRERLTSPPRSYAADSAVAVEAMRPRTTLEINLGISIFRSPCGFGAGMRELRRHRPPASGRTGSGRPRSAPRSGASAGSYSRPPHRQGALHHLLRHHADLLRRPPDARQPRRGLHHPADRPVRHSVTTTRRIRRAALFAINPNEPLRSSISPISGACPTAISANPHSPGAPVTQIILSTCPGPSSASASGCCSAFTLGIAWAC